MSNFEIYTTIEKSLMSPRLKELEETNPPLFCALIYLVGSVIALNKGIDQGCLTDQDILENIGFFEYDLNDLSDPALLANHMEYLQDRWALSLDPAHITVNILTADGKDQHFHFKKEMIYVEGEIHLHIANRIKEIVGDKGLEIYQSKLEPEIEELKKQIKAITSNQDE